ncbi:MAG: glycerophosphodiester phosphodiesterase [Anaerolineaceae bacterium]|nr:glycerophosphodiester phosphodiesterase [Anaerolineaceae bacterium]
MKPILLVHHSANRDHSHPRGSLPALLACLQAGALAVEVDISLLADGQFALLHGPMLEDETTGSGPIAALDSEQVSALEHALQGKATGVPVGLLPQALDLLAAYPGQVELQLDLKPDVYSSDEVLGRLVASLQPVKDRVRVTSPSDWALRRLHRLDPDLALGFDPLLYLELDMGQENDASVPPFRRGAYGYWDDHPLATRRWGPPAAYLAARAEALWAQAPAGAIWYIHAGLLARALDDGFDWIGFLHDRGVEVDAWTLDAGKPERVALARRLAAAGVDRITTNTAPALSQVLDAATVY